MKKTTAFIFALILIGSFAAVYWSYRDLPITDDDTDTADDDDSDDNATNDEKIYRDILKLDSLLENDVIQNPVSIKGEARGAMYFEAIFRIAVQDANHKELGFGVATAIGEWTTSEFVPFEAKISYQNPITKTGYLIFEKDNPSGLPENDLAISVPISFGN